MSCLKNPLVSCFTNVQTLSPTVVSGLAPPSPPSTDTKVRSYTCNEIMAHIEEMLNEVLFSLSLHFIMTL